MQLPLGMGGLSLPNFQLYYWAAVLVTGKWWFSQARDNLAVTLEAAIVGSYSTLKLVSRGPRAHLEITILMRTIVLVWRRAQAKYHTLESFSPHAPLWGNPSQPHMHSSPDPSVWV